MWSDANFAETIGPIWRQWRRYVSGAFRRVLGPSSEAEDLTQEVFLVVCEALHRGEQIEDPRAYLVATIANVLRSHLRRRQRTMPVYDKMQSVPAAPDRGIAEGNGHQSLGDLLWRLPMEERLTVVAWHYLGMTRAQIGEMLGLPRSTINRRYARAIERMRRMIEGIEGTEGTEGEEHDSENANHDAF
jgi:RNA polymerase sigma factor (sigma-70 family)